MTPEQKPAFFALLADVHAFYRRDFSDFAGRVWWEAMKRFDLQKITQAFSAHAVTPDGGRFMPMPADLVALLAGSAQDHSFQIWASAERVLQGSASVKSLDPIAQEILGEMGGVHKLGMTHEDKLRFVAQDFMERYRLRSKRELVPGGTPLPGKSHPAIEHERQ